MADQNTRADALLKPAMYYQFNMARNSQPPKEIVFDRHKLAMVFSYAEWQAMIETGKFDFTQHDLTAATFHPDGYLGHHHVSVLH